MKTQIKHKQTPAKQIMQLIITVIILTFILEACNSKSDKKQIKLSQAGTESTTYSVPQNDTLDAVVKSIIAISANDFYKNQQPLPVTFRNVQIKYSIKPNKEVLYILCGEFTTQDKQKNDEWTHFTTIKNSDYEQWIGPNGLTYCENSKEITYKKTDLSAELKTQLNSLQNIKK
jgi:hypothetical protein